MCDLQCIHILNFSLMAHCTSGAIRGSVTLRQGIELATFWLLNDFSTSCTTVAPMKHPLSPWFNFKPMPPPTEKAQLQRFLLQLSQHMLREEATDPYWCPNVRCNKQCTNQRPGVALNYRRGLRVSPHMIHRHGVAMYMWMNKRDGGSKV